MRNLVSLLGAALFVAEASAAQAGLGAPQTDAGAGAPPSAPATVLVAGQVCLPLIEGAKLKPVAASVGMKQEKGEWILPIEGKRRIEVFPPDAGNPTTCSATITHGVGAQPAIRQALDLWAKSLTPPLTPVKIDVRTVGESYRRTTSTWEGPLAKGSVGVVLSEEKTLQGAPADGDLDRTTLFVGLTAKGS